MKGVKKSRKERGAELVEFALVLPFLLLLVGGAIEFGRAFYTYHILSKAVRDGARYLATSQISSSGTIDSTAESNTRNLVVHGTTNTSGPGYCQTFLPLMSLRTRLFPGNAFQLDP